MSISEKVKWLSKGENMKNFSKILWGLVFVLIGVVIATNSFGLTNIDIFFEVWWTLFIIVPSFISLFDTHEGKMGNLVVFIIGLLLLLAARGVIDFEVIVKMIVPLIFIAIGLSMIFNRTIKSTISKKVKEGKGNGLETIVATFSEQRINKDNEKFKGANLDSVFGNIVLDLRKAKLEDEMVVDASAIFGGAVILVPHDVNIKVKATPIFGGVSNSALNYCFHFYYFVFSVWSKY